MHLRTTTSAGHRQSTIILFSIDRSPGNSICSLIVLIWFQTSNRLKIVESNIVPTGVRWSNMPPINLSKLHHVWARFFLVSWAELLSACAYNTQRARYYKKHHEWKWPKNEFWYFLKVEVIGRVMYTTPVWVLSTVVFESWSWPKTCPRWPVLNQLQLSKNIVDRT